MSRVGLRGLITVIIVKRALTNKMEATNGLDTRG